MTIETIPDEALLEIFSIYLEGASKADRADSVEDWRTLVHVCQRWRRVVFASPRRLNLKLVCNSKRPVKELLGIWPALPIVIHDCQFGGRPWLTIENVDRIIAALGHRDRVCQINLFDSIPHSLLEQITGMMQESFPALTHLFLVSKAEIGPAPVLSDSFLGESAPRLRELTLNGLPFPALPKLLLSTNDLVELCLWDIPYSGYISPEAIVPSLSSLTHLYKFALCYDSYQSRPDASSQRLPSLTRVDLPSLVELDFHGANEYLEDLVTRINAPLLHDLRISVFDHPPFDITQLKQFVGRIEHFGVFYRAYVKLYHEACFIRFENTEHLTSLEFHILCPELQGQVVSLEQVCRPFSSSILLSTKRLEFEVCHPVLDRWGDYLGSAPGLWVLLLRPFTALKDLYISEELAIRLLHELRGESPESGESSGNEESSEDLLPALQSIFVERGPSFGDAQAAIGPFAAAWQDSGHPVAVYSWSRREDDDELQEDGVLQEDDE